MSLKVLILLLLILISTTHAAVYKCTQNSPRPSQFFDRIVKIECDFDSLGKPKFVILSGSSKMPLHEKAQYIGPDTVKLYELHQMKSLDGQTIDLHSASALYTETAQASFFTVEPNKGSGFWICRIER